jgi:hypothetical protein
VGVPGRIKCHILVSRDDRSSIRHHYEFTVTETFIAYPDLQPGMMEIQVTPHGASVSKNGLSKTWHVLVRGRVTGIVYLDTTVSITVPPFNGQGDPGGIPWIDIQNYTIEGDNP